MPSERDHLRQVQQNRDLITALDPATTPFLDWVVTAVFYTALHRIEAWLATKGQHFQSHENRDDWIKRSPELRGVVWRNYKDLEHFSRQARYQCVGFNRDFVQNDIFSYLHSIEQEIQRLP
jgi:hypothetical protein